MRSKNEYLSILKAAADRCLELKAEGPLDSLWMDTFFGDAVASLFLATGSGPYGELARDILLYHADSDRTEDHRPLNFFNLHPFARACRVLRDQKVLSDEEQELLLEYIRHSARVSIVPPPEWFDNVNLPACRAASGMEAANMVYDEELSREIRQSVLPILQDSLIFPSPEDSEAYNALWLFGILLASEAAGIDVSQNPVCGYFWNFLAHLTTPAGVPFTYGDSFTNQAIGLRMAVLERGATLRDDPFLRTVARRTLDYFIRSDIPLPRTPAETPEGPQKRDGNMLEYWAIAHAYEWAEDGPEFDQPMESVDLGRKIVLRDQEQNGLYLVLNKNGSLVHGCADPLSIPALTFGHSVLLQDTPYGDNRTVRHNTITVDRDAKTSGEIEKVIVESRGLYGCMENATGALMDPRTAWAEIIRGRRRDPIPEIDVNIQRRVELASDRGVLIRDRFFSYLKLEVTPIVTFFTEEILDRGETDAYHWFLGRILALREPCSYLHEFANPDEYRLAIVFPKVEGQMAGTVAAPFECLSFLRDGRPWKDYSGFPNICIYQAIRLKPVQRPHTLSTRLLAIRADEDLQEAIARHFEQV